MFFELMYYNYLNNLVAASARPQLPPRQLIPKTFDDMPSSTFREQFRFAKEDIATLVHIFELPEYIKLPNGSRLDAKLAVCILLRKLVFPVRAGDLEDKFGIDRSVCSRAVNWLLHYINTNYGFLLLMRKCIVNTHKNTWSQAIASTANCPLDSCLGFIDGTNKAICRPVKYQKKTYSGHKRQHTLKYQGVVIPCGILFDLHGPHLGIRHDARILVESDLLRRLEHAVPRGFYIYGDPAYRIQRFILGPYEQVTENTPESEFNSLMSKVRISVEWSFGGLLNLFRSLQYAKHWRLYSQPVGLYYKIAAILYNIHGILYGNQISTYFNCRIALQDYLHYCRDCLDASVDSTAFSETTDMVFEETETTDCESDLEFDINDEELI